MNDLISVIVPVYNVEKYLDKCVDSIVNQTYKNLEIILVDDGSPDKCPEICDEWAKKDERIKVIHKENGGAASARNKGIEGAKGKYIAFTDADDYVNSDFVKTLYDNLSLYDSDISMCGFNMIYPNKTIVVGSKIEGVLTKEYCFENYYEDYGFYIYPWNKLYNKKLFDDLRFQDGLFFEDADLLYKLFDKAVKISVTKNVCCNYFSREGSLSYSELSEKQFDIIKILDDIIAFLKANNYTKAYYNLLPVYLYKCRVACIFSKNNISVSKAKEFKSKFNCAIKDYLFNFNKMTVDSSKREVFRNILFYISPCLFKSIYKDRFMNL